MEYETIVQDLRMMGIGRRYLGYQLTIKAVRMVVMNENLLLAMKQGIYEPLARESFCDWRAVERNIRTIIHRAWHVNREHLCALAGYPMRQEPTVSEFLEMLSVHVRSHFRT